MNIAYVVKWTDTGSVMKAAESKGWSENSADSLADVVDFDSHTKEKEFASLAKAKNWARRNRSMDIWNEPDIAIYQWPNDRRLSWERETVRILRYIGNGLGWEEICGGTAA